MTTEQILSTRRLNDLISPVITHERPVSYLEQEYNAWKSLFAAQPAPIRSFLETQARQITEALLQGSPQIRFTLPESVMVPVEEADAKKEYTLSVPSQDRRQIAGSWWNRYLHANLSASLRQRLVVLETSAYLAVAVSSGLIRYAIGRVLAEALPPEWAAFDHDGRLLAGTLSEAESYLASLQHCLKSMQLAAGLAPYFAADEDFQQKRYGVIEHTTHQGRALADYKVGLIILGIKQKIEKRALDRGFSLSLPYFDDQRMEIRTYDFAVTPGGRVMFTPAFIVLAVMKEHVKVAQDARLSPSTRKHLLAELECLEEAFRGI